MYFSANNGLSQPIRDWSMCKDSNTKKTGQQLISSAEGKNHLIT
jgi:hypothetical protein